MDGEKIKTHQKLGQILINFIDVLRINILIVDSQGMPVLVPKTSGYGFHGASQWGVLRYVGSPDFIPQFQIEGRYYLKSVDDFGFQVFAIPIPLGSMDDIGYLILGPVILNKQFEQSKYQSIAEKSNINSTDFLNYLGEVRIVTFNTLKSILDLLFELSRYAMRMDEVPQVQTVDQLQTTHSIFTNLLDLAMALTQAECGSVMLLNNLTNELSILASKGINLQGVRDISMKLDEGVAGLAVQQKEPYVINEDQPNNRIRHLLKKPQLKCALVLPIIKNNKEVLGVLNISTRQGKSRLATHSQEMLKSLTEITSGTFSNFV